MSQLKVNSREAVVGLMVPIRTGVNAAGQSGKKVGHHKGQYFPGKGVNPHGPGQDFVVPDGHETQPQEGKDQTVHDQQGQKQKGQDQSSIGRPGV